MIGEIHAEFDTFIKAGEMIGFIGALSCKG